MIILIPFEKLLIGEIDNVNANAEDFESLFSLNFQIVDTTCKNGIL